MTCYLYRLLIQQPVRSPLQLYACGQLQRGGGIQRNTWGWLRLVIHKTD